MYRDWKTEGSLPTRGQENVNAPVREWYRCEQVWNCDPLPQPSIPGKRRAPQVRNKDK